MMVALVGCEGRTIEDLRREASELSLENQALKEEILCLQKQSQ